MESALAPSPVREKVAAEQPDEGLTATIRTSSVAYGDTFSFKEKETRYSSRMRA
jgi:hypothetical protein